MEGGLNTCSVGKQILQLTVCDLFTCQHYELFNKTCAIKQPGNYFPLTMENYSHVNYTFSPSSVKLNTLLTQKSNSYLASLAPLSSVSLCGYVCVCVCVHLQQNTLGTNIEKKWQIHNWNWIENWNSTFIYVLLYLFTVIDRSYLLNSVIEVPCTVNSSYKCNCCM